MPEQKEIEWQKRRFEVNMLDGDKVEDCGRSMLSVESVWEYFSDVLSTLRTQEREQLAEKIKNLACDAGDVVTGYVVPLSDVLTLLEKPI